MKLNKTDDLIEKGQCLVNKFQLTRAWLFFEIGALYMNTFVLSMFIFYNMRCFKNCKREDSFETFKKDEVKKIADNIKLYLKN